IVAVADSIEVMASRSLYRAPRTAGEVVAELEAGSGTQWDPQIVRLALDLFESGELSVADERVTLRGLEESAAHARSVPVLLVEHDPGQAQLERKAIEAAVPGAAVSLANDLAT